MHQLVPFSTISLELDHAYSVLSDLTSCAYVVGMLSREAQLIAGRRKERRPKRSAAEQAAWNHPKAGLVCLTHAFFFGKEGA
jgi:hypothetical protein